jgi:hypothetical protein
MLMRKAFQAWKIPPNDTTLLLLLSDEFERVLSLIHIVREYMLLDLMNYFLCVYLKEKIDYNKQEQMFLLT